MVMFVLKVDRSNEWCIPLNFMLLPSEDDAF